MRSYRSAAISKTGTRNRLEALRIAEKAGWLQVGSRSVVARR